MNTLFGAGYEVLFHAGAGARQARGQVAGGRRRIAGRRSAGGGRRAGDRPGGAARSGDAAADPRDRALGDGVSPGAANAARLRRRAGARAGHARRAPRDLRGHRHHHALDAAQDARDSAVEIPALRDAHPPGGHGNPPERPALEDARPSAPPDSRPAPRPPPRNPKSPDAPAPSTRETPRSFAAPSRRARFPESLLPRVVPLLGWDPVARDAIAALRPRGERRRRAARARAPRSARRVHDPPPRAAGPGHDPRSAGRGRARPAALRRALRGALSRGVTRSRTCRPRTRPSRSRASWSSPPCSARSRPRPACGRAGSSSIRWTTTPGRRSWTSWCATARTGASSTSSRCSRWSCRGSRCGSRSGGCSRTIRCCAGRRWNIWRRRCRRRSGSRSGPISSRSGPGADPRGGAKRGEAVDELLRMNESIVIKLEELRGKE